MIDDYATRFLEKAILRFVDADDNLNNLGKMSAWAECVVAAEYLCAAVTVLLSTGIPTYREIIVESGFNEQTQPTEEDLLNMLESKVEGFISDTVPTNRFVDAIKELLSLPSSYSLSDAYKRISSNDTPEE